MIIVKNRELLIPNHERYIGTTYDNETENRVFQVPRFSQRGVDLAALTFRLDIQYANEAFDTVLLDKEVGEAFIILIWRITSATLQVPGTLYIGLRAIDDEATVKWSSFSAAMYAERHLNTPGNYGGSLTEIEQIEQDHQYMKGVVDELKANIDYAHDAEAWAQGTRSGTAVPSTDKTYHKNSKYYSEQANTKATAAANSATQAANSATQAAETVADTNTRFNNAMAAVTSDTEVIDARVGADGTTYPVLKTRLDTEHTQLKSQIDAINKDITPMVSLDVGLYVNTSTHTWRPDANANYFAYYVNVGDVVSMTSPSGGSVAYSVLKNANPVLDQVAQFATGFSNFPGVGGGQSVSFTCQESGYLYIVKGHTPSVFTINGISYTELYTSKTIRERIVDLEDSDAETADQINDLETVDANLEESLNVLIDEIRPSEQLDINAYINTDVDKWINDGNTYHYKIYAVKPGDVIYMKAPGNASSAYTVLKDAEPVINETPTYASGYSGGFIKLDSNQDVQFTVPNDGKYLYTTLGLSEPERFTINSVPVSDLYTSTDLRFRIIALEQNRVDITDLENTVSEHTTKIASIESAISGGLTGEGGTVLISSVSDLLAINSVKPNVAVLSNDVTYELDQICYIPDDTVIIGNGATIKRKNGYDGLLLRLADHCSVYGLKIDGNRENTVSPTWDTTTEIRVAGANCIIENVIITDGNEAIVCYGNDVLIKKCKFTNCGGNAIHFSGAQRTRVEDCVVIGANKRQGMGHEDGCIIWSNTCEHQVCMNNWCEDGISGFGSIDSVDNANIKLIGNTVKDCTYAVEAQYTSLQPSNLIIADNQFINSGSVLIRRVGGTSDNGTVPAMVNVSIEGNLLNGTDINCRYLARLSIKGNTVDLGTIYAVGCPFCVVSDNVVDSNGDYGIYCASRNAVISGNSVLSNLNAVYASGAKGSVIEGNSLRTRILDSNNYPGSPCVVSSGGTITIKGNTIFATYGLYLYAETICTDNIVKCRLSGETAIGQGSGGSGITRNNLYYGAFNVASSAASVSDSNLLVSAPDTYNVSYTLTDITKVGGSAVWANDSLLVVLTPEDGHELPDTITISMDGVVLPLITMGDYVNVPDGYTYDKNTGIVRIPSVTGAVVITAAAA